MTCTGHFLAQALSLSISASACQKWLETLPIAKRTGNYTDWCEYKQARNEVNSLLETAHHNHCTDLFNDSSTSNKRFWSYSY